jgi:hypothetical protein
VHLLRSGAQAAALLQVQQELQVAKAQAAGELARGGVGIGGDG